MISARNCNAKVCFGVEAPRAPLNQMISKLQTQEEGTKINHVSQEGNGKEKNHRESKIAYFWGLRQHLGLLESLPSGQCVKLQ